MFLRIIVGVIVTLTYNTILAVAAPSDTKILVDDLFNLTQLERQQITRIVAALAIGFIVTPLEIGMREKPDQPSSWVGYLLESLRVGITTALISIGVIRLFGNDLILVLGISGAFSLLGGYKLVKTIRARLARESGGIISSWLKRIAGVSVDTSSNQKENGKS